MPTFKACVRKRRRDGFWTVFIRVTHRRRSMYMATDLLATSYDLSQAKEIKSAHILRRCSQLILEYNKCLQAYALDGLEVGDVVSLLKDSREDLSFSDYCQSVIDRLINEGRLRTVKNYVAALRSLRLYLGSDQIPFSMLTVSRVRGWIEELASHTARAKEQYPTLMRSVFCEAEKRFNDYEREVIRIKYNPFLAVAIPTADTPQKRALAVEDVRALFSAPVPESKWALSREEMSRDVAFLSLCLVGMNTIDLFNLRKEDYDGETISYCRSKSRNLRHDDAFIRVRIEPFVRGTLVKYMSGDGDPYLLNFHIRYSDPDSFSSNMNGGLKKFCAAIGHPDLRPSIYSFRHTWATLAQNAVGASYSEIGFALNHSKHRGVTEAYVKPDFRPIWELNAKVLRFIFFSCESATAKESGRRLFRLTEKTLVSGSAYCNGRCLSRLRGIGYGTVDDVIRALADGIQAELPAGARVYFDLENEDNGETAQYMHTKGKGF